MTDRENDKKLLKKYFKERPELDDAEKQATEKLFNTASSWSPEKNDIESSLQDFKTRLASETKEAITIRWQVWSSIAATLLVGLAMAYYFLIFPQETRYQTQRAETLKVTLPDASSVYLDVESSLSFNSTTWKEDRVIYLTGKAYFDVKEGGSFKVMSTNGQVEVLGTTFTISDRNEAYEVECYTGEVQVNSYNQTVNLTLGQKVALVDKGLIKSTIEVPGATSWITGILKFRKKPLSDLFNEIERQFDVVINYQSPEALFFSGVVDINEGAEVTLEKISLIMGLNLTPIEGGYSVSAKNN